jgi:hypothetical protein
VDAISKDNNRCEKGEDGTQLVAEAACEEELYMEGVYTETVTLFGSGVWTLHPA